MPHKRGNPPSPPDMQAMDRQPQSPPPLRWPRFMTRDGMTVPARMQPVERSFPTHNDEAEQIPAPSEYSDYFAWTQEQCARLRAMSLGEAKRLGLDRDNLAEEIEDLGKRELRDLESQVIRVLHHLMKWKYQPGKRSRSWKMTIIEARYQIEDSLQSKALQAKITDDLLLKLSTRARRLAITETGLSEAAIPQRVQFTLDDVRDHNFYPESEVT